MNKAGEGIRTRHVAVVQAALGLQLAPEPTSCGVEHGLPEKPMRWFPWLPWRQPPPIDEAAWRRAVAACPLAQRLSAPEQQRLRRLAARFLQRKRFYPVDMTLAPHQRLLIALQACVPIRHLGFRVLRDWQTVIVYPAMFRVPHDRRDSAGVITEGAQIRLGESWKMGPLVLAWEPIAQNLEHPWDGHNLVAHEIAHKLDMLRGTADGLPPLSREMSTKTWIDTFQHAFDRLRQARQQGEETRIDPYATTNPAEYFAVVSELHFSDPQRLQQAEPEVARLLCRYYGPSPAP